MALDVMLHGAAVGASTRATRAPANFTGSKRGVDDLHAKSAAQTWERQVGEVSVQRSTSLVHDAQAHSQIGEDELGLHSITPSMSRSVEGALSVRCQGRTDSKRAVRAAMLCWQRSPGGASAGGVGSSRLGWRIAHLS